MTDKRYNNIKENLREIRHNIEEAALAAGRDPCSITLMAVTKTVPAEIVNLAVMEGVTLLGENKAQELLSKIYSYDKSASIHFIGHLQTNKVRDIIGKVDMIQSVDSVRLAAEINRRAKEKGRICDVLIEVNTGGEASKSGVAPEGVFDFAMEIAGYDGLRLRGLMTIPPFCDRMEESERYFDMAHKLFVDIRAKNRDNDSIGILSMGMSGDYPAAIKHGATIIRLGTALFGARDYSFVKTV